MSRIWRGLMVGLTGAGTACTLASGWSDLQSGPVADAGSRDGTIAPTDSDVPLDAKPSETGVDTGALTGTTEQCDGFGCKATETCCFDPGFGKGCETPAKCAADDGWSLGCQTKAGCATGLCCFDFNNLSATCEPSCNITSVPLCDPAKPECPAGQQCTRNIGTAELKGCQ